MMASWQGLSRGQRENLTAAVLPVQWSARLALSSISRSIVAVNSELLNGVYSGNKAFVLNLTQSLHKEVGDKGFSFRLCGWSRSR
jgi:short-subunit dehydrogenase